MNKLIVLFLCYKDFGWFKEWVMNVLEILRWFSFYDKDLIDLFLKFFCDR